MKIGTHSGHFHADEVLAVAMLLLLQEYKNAEIVRSRDKAVLDTCDIVVDVGDVYDPTNNRFDHHQKGFDEFFDSHHRTTVLSSAGLIYKHFGRRIIAEQFGVTDESEIDYTFKHVYDHLIEAIDAIDNGVAIAGCELRYKVTTDLSSRVGRLNPSWREGHVVQQTRFLQALEVARADFESQVDVCLKVLLPAKQLVLSAIEARFNVHPSGRVIELIKGCPFSEFLYGYEEEMGLDESSRILYYIAHDVNECQWRATATHEKGIAFKSRLPFPERLRGLRDAALVKEAGIDDLIFVHRTGFTSGAKTREAILKLITLSLKEGGQYHQSL